MTLEEANEFLQGRKLASTRIAIATFLCILSVIPLLILGALTELSSFPIPENLACGIGLITMFIVVSVAVAIFIFCGFKNSAYEFLDKEPFDTEYGVRGMVKEKQKAYRDTYVKSNIVGTCICVLSPIPLFIGAFSENEFLTVILLTATMLIAGIGVFLFINAGVRWASMQKLLKEGEFSVEEKKRSKVKEPVAGIYWLVATAIYLGWNFTTNQWQSTWIVWPVAGVLFAVVMAICNLLIDKENKQ